MTAFNFFETILLVSLAITFVLIMFLVYHFKQRITITEEKTDTMFDIINNMAKEMTNIRTTMNMVVQPTIQIPRVPSYNKIDVSDGSDDESESGSDEDDSGDENDFIELDEAGAPVVGNEPKKSKIQSKKKIVKKKVVATEPVVEAAPKPVAEATPEPVNEAAPEPVTEEAAEPVTKEAAEPVVKKKATKKKTVAKKVTKKKTVAKKTVTKKTTKKKTA